MVQKGHTTHHGCGHSTHNLTRTIQNFEPIFLHFALLCHDINLASLQSGNAEIVSSGSRVGRFLMNVMMASGGYPWTIIPVENRTAYMHALEKASVGEDIAPFADFVAGLVEKRLAACVQIGSPILSVYRWKGEIEESSEIPLAIKSSRELFPRIQAEIKRLHSYEVPEIVALPIVDGAEDYLLWLEREVAEIPKPKSARPKSARR